MPNVKAVKASQKRSEHALESFHRFYAAQWGEQRWHESLYPALAQPTRYCALLNKYAGVEQAGKIIDDTNQNANLHELILPDLSGTSNVPIAMIRGVDDTSSFPAPQSLPLADGKHSLQSHWNLDGASVLAAHLLDIQPGDAVLDLCAAPGGKSIVIAQALWPHLYSENPFSSPPNQPPGCLHSNESDSKRYKRLSANLAAYLPLHHASCNLKTSNIDASAKDAVLDLPLGPTSYDRILLDAPCSSERHVIHAHLKAASSGMLADEMMNWKPTHSKLLSRTQVALLVTALRALKVNGRLVYATCSIARQENDEVVERAIDAVRKERKKYLDAGDKTWAWKVVVDERLEKSEAVAELLDRKTEKTGLGRIALPDHPGGEGWGPLYFCVLRKVEYKKSGKVEDGVL